MKQIIIHAGFHKTATTSIQDTCAKNKDKLEELGFYYPIFNLGSRVIVNHSVPFYSLFASQPDKYHMNIRWGVDAREANKKYEGQLNHILQQKHEKIIISGEDISYLSQLELNRIKEKIQSHGYGMRVIVFVRSPLSYINSESQQQVKHGSSIEEVVYLTTINKIKKIEAVFPEAEFFSFRDACQHKHGPVGNFFELIGVADFSSLEFINSNTSTSNQVIRLISFINKEQPFFINNKINPCRRNGDTAKLHRIKGNKFQLNENELKKFKEQINQENKYLLNKFGASFCDKKPYWSSDLEKIKWSDEQIEQLKTAISESDENIKIIAHDYFKKIICLDEEKLSYVFF